MMGELFKFGVDLSTDFTDLKKEGFYPRIPLRRDE
jgi:hypothetical protein